MESSSPTTLCQAATLALLLALLVGAARANTPTPTPSPATDNVQPPIDGGGDGMCEAVNAPICSSIDYDNAYFPNLRGQTQTEASVEILDFIPLFQSACSGAVLHFFCSFYFQFCDPNTQLTLKPCMSFCEFVRIRCAPEFEKTSGNFTWPYFLNCSMADTFPDSTPETLGCFSPPQPEGLTVPTIPGLLTPVPQTPSYTASPSLASTSTPMSTVLPSRTPSPPINPTPSSAAITSQSPLMLLALAALGRFGMSG